MDLRLGNCLDTEIGLTTIESKSIDMILCDLPYGITDNKWDNTFGSGTICKNTNRKFIGYKINEEIKLSNG